MKKITCQFSFYILNVCPQKTFHKKTCYKTSIDNYSAVIGLKSEAIYIYYFILRNFWSIYRL